MTSHLLTIEGVGKRFVMHARQGTELTVLRDVHLTLDARECVVLEGPSGMGKSTLLKLIYANYRATGGSIKLHSPGKPVLDIAQANDRELVRMRRDDVGYVSQFLRVIPRIAALDVVAEPLLDGIATDAHAVEAAREKASSWLRRLSIPGKLWGLPPATFSGGEQQRINIARNMIKPKPLLLLDEPTASLDEANVHSVVDLIAEARNAGAAVLGIFHDERVRSQVATRRVNMSEFKG